MRLFGKTEDFTFSDGHLQAYCCSLVRGILNEALAGNLDFLDGAVFPHTCDSMQRLSDIWRINTSFSLHGDLVLPVKLNTDTAKTYMVDVLKLFMQRTGEQLGVVITGEDLEKAIQETNSIRKALCDLAAMRERSPGAVSGSDMYVAACASMIMAPSEWLDTMNS
ncbi:MAG: 2-hydroxyacyl-CoA dehydratase, partial [Deltaproteobacteria bacterium]